MPQYWACKRERILTPEGQRIHGFKMSNSIDHIVKIIIQIGPNFISQESVKNIACVGQKGKKFEQKEVVLQTAKRS